MTFLSHDAMASATGGRWVGPPRSGEPLAGIGTDTRVSLRGRAFVALVGEQHDAHNHLGAAQSAGAAALIVSRFPDGFTPSVPTLLVRDTLAALHQLATAWRAEVSPFTIGITGSSGKTTTRRLLHGVLSQQQRGTSSPKSFNNEIGVPLTMLSAARGDDFLLLEMGMNHPGEIRRLSAIAEQDAAVITMVGRAHLGGMGSLEAIAVEKASIADGLPACAPVIANGDNAPLMKALAEFGRCDLRMITFGTDAARNVRLVSREQHPRGAGRDGARSRPARAVRAAAAWHPQRDERSRRARHGSRSRAHAGAGGAWARHGRAIGDAHGSRADRISRCLQRRLQRQS